MGVSIKKYGIFIMIGLFCVLYHPPIFSFNSMHIVGLLSWIYLFFFDNKIGTINIKVFVCKVFFDFALIGAYIIVICILLNNGPLTSVADSVFYMVDVIPFAIVISRRGEKRGCHPADFINLLIATGLLQAFTSILAFANRSIQDRFLAMVISYGYAERLLRLSSARLFGLSNWLTFTTPCIQAILSLLCFATLQNRKHKVLCLISGLILFFSATINARTALVVMIIGFFTFVILSNNSAKSKLFIVLLSIVILFLSLRYGMPMLERYSPKTYLWLLSGTEQLSAFARGTELRNSYFNYFSREGKVVFPEGIGLLIGEGFRLFANNRGYIPTDIGYINDIWLGGLAYVALKYGIYIKYMRGLIISNNSTTHFFGLLLTALFFVLNIKGSVFSMNGLSNLLVVAYVCSSTYIVKRKSIELTETDDSLAA